MAYEKGKPEPGIKAKLLDDRVRGNNDFIQPAINNEHNFVDADANNQSGDHTQGSARCFSQATAPATRIDGSTFESTDLGSLWVDTDDNALYILTAITPTWTAVSTEVIETLLGSARTFLDTLSVIGDFDVNTDKFTVDAATGNAELAGTLNIASTIAITAMLDEDDMASDSATAVASQQSIKAYVDALVLPSGLTGGNDSIGETVIGELYLKWGVKARDSATTTVTFANPFPSACFQVVSANKDTTLDASSVGIDQISRFSFDFHASTTTDAIHWFALGR